MTRIRKDVWTLTKAEGEWPAALKAYERAVGLLRARDPASGKPRNPLGWRFLAAMHGLEGQNRRPDTSNPLWSNCQHGSWYFLPWHRMYLLAFETIVQNALEDESWSLPYWYTISPDDPTTSVLPPAFRDTGRALYTEKRSYLANGGTPLHSNLGQSVIDALDAHKFSTEQGTSTFGGGERAESSFRGGERGLLEGPPHGSVHSIVGDDFDGQGNPYRFGWMGDFFTAGLDPVFWLHHANIDRLWQVWIEHDPSNLNPTDDPAWFDTEFSFPAVGGGLQTWSIGDVLDIESLGYNYESTAAPSALPPPAAPPGGGGPDIGLAEVTVPEPIPPQVLGATQDVPLATPEPVDVALSEPVDLGLALGTEGGSGDGKVFLRIEGVTGTAAAPVYEVYLNVPPGDEPFEHPELRAGYFSTFGLIEASQSDDLHDGSGLTTVLEVTGVRDVLEHEGRWDAGRLQVSFSPVIPPRPDQVPDDAERAEARPADLRAGQITVVVT